MIQDLLEVAWSLRWQLLALYGGAIVFSVWEARRA